MHYAVLVAGTDPVDQLVPYWDQAEMEPYVLGTVAEIFEDHRAQLMRAREAVRASGDSRPTPYADSVLVMTLAEFVEHIREDYHHVDDEGQVWDDRNPQGCWDYWCIGGRWAGALRTRSGHDVDETTLADLDLEQTCAPFAVVVHGDLHTCRDVPDEVWSDQWKTHLSDLPGDTPVAMLDAHG